MELQTRVEELERKLGDLTRKMDDVTNQTASNNKDINAMSVKIDGIRDDLREIKRLGDLFVPRAEIESRLASVNDRVATTEREIGEITGKLHEAIVNINQSLHKNTIATYGILISMLLTAIGLLFSMLK